MRTTTTVMSLAVMATLAQGCDRAALPGGHGQGGGGAATAVGGAAGSTAGSGGIAGASADAAAGGVAGSSIVGSCTVDADCVAVLDYRAGFECYFPSAASLADVARDPCLVAWNPSNPRCPLATPPDDCPGGLILVNHSCPAYCHYVTCTSGTCTMNADFSTPSRCSSPDADAPPDCNALRATYFARLAAAQRCDPSTTPTSCFDAFYDSCGCPAAADLSGRQATALQCALDAVQKAQCGFGNCGTPCPSGAVTPACTPNPGGTSGTCAVR
jgi:hypothetical protein